MSKLSIGDLYLYKHYVGVIVDTNTPTCATDTGETITVDNIDDLHLIAKINDTLKTFEDAVCRLVK